MREFLEWFMDESQDRTSIAGTGPVQIASANPRITWEYVQAHPDWPWDYKRLSSNPGIQVEVVFANPHLPWDWNEVSSHPGLTWDHVVEHHDKPWDWSRLSKNIAVDVILAERQKREWDWQNISLNPSLEWRHVTEIIHDIPCGLVWDNVAKVVKLTCDEFILSEKMGLWNYACLSQNPHIIDIVDCYVHYPWNWECLSRNLGVTQDFTEKHADKPWNWAALASHRNLSWNWLKEHIPMDRLASSIAMNPTVTIDVVRANPDVAWSKDYLLANPNMTFEYWSSEILPTLPYEKHMRWTHWKLLRAT